MRIQSTAVVAILAAVALSGCTRSLQVKYAKGFEKAETFRAPAKQKIAVLPFVDTRSWVDASNVQSTSYVAQQGVWKFGLTYGTEAYIPVSKLVQTLFVDELVAAGYESAPADKAIADGYTLSGKIVAFEFQNDAGMLTVTSRRSITLALTLTDKDGTKLGEDMLFAENDRENEGMGVTHSTNVDKLFNRVFKKVVGDVLLKLQGRFQGAQVKVSLNGVPVDVAPLLAMN